MLYEKACDDDETYKPHFLLFKKFLDGLKGFPDRGTGVQQNINKLKDRIYHFARRAAPTAELAAAEELLKGLMRFIHWPNFQAEE